MSSVVGTAAHGTLEGALAAPHTRRRLLAVGGAAALALAIEPAVRLVERVSAPGPSPRARGSSFLRTSTFAPLLGERFTLRGDTGGRVPARLVEIRNLRRGAQRGTVRGHAEEAFALRFHAPRSAPRIGQGVHRLHHPALGTFSLLVTPSGTGRRGQDYEAVINRLHPSR